MSATQFTAVARNCRVSAGAQAPPAALTPRSNPPALLTGESNAGSPAEVAVDPEESFVPMMLHRHPALTKCLERIEGDLRLAPDAASGMRQAVAVAREWRERLGMLQRPACILDPWRLLIELEVRDGIWLWFPRCIQGYEDENWGGYWPRGKHHPPIVELISNPRDHTLRALTLAHELGHHLCPAPEALLAVYDTCPVACAHAELLADAFALAFIGVDAWRFLPAECLMDTEMLAEQAVESVIELAHSLREVLGIAHRVPEADDAWLLADYLREGVEIEVTESENPNGGHIYYMPSADVPDVITLSVFTTEPTRQARILAHELGHYLCTQPLRIAGETSETQCQRYFARFHRAELLAEAFAIAFLDANAMDRTRTGPVEFGYYWREAELAARAEREVEDARELAHALRATLGIHHRRPDADDAWLLAEHLREGVLVVEDEITTGRIVYCGRQGKPDVITVPRTELASAAQRAFILSHELGHHLCTQPLLNPDCSAEEYARWLERPKERNERIANAFAAAFLGIPIPDATDRHLPRGKWVLDVPHGIEVAR